jgi:hypothetical protein
MTDVTIPNLTPAIALGASDQIEIVQNGASKSATLGLFSVFSPSLSVPLTITAGSYTVGTLDTSIICNNSSGTITLTLPAPATFPARIIRLKTMQAQTVVSAGSNVVPLIGGSASTAILAATAGKWAEIQSDGSNWIIMAAN